MFASWEQWKKGFDAWEGATAKLAEAWMRSPLVLQPAGAALSLTMRGKARVDRALTRTWSAVGLANKRDQERTLHLLNELSSRLLDLEERLEDAEERALARELRSTTEARVSR